MRIFLIVISLLLSASPSQAAGQTDSILPDCDEFQGWQETREQLGGFYFTDGWSADFISVLQITAIDGSIQGSFIGIELADDGTFEHTTVSVTGLYDESQVSLTLQGLLSTVTLTGTWTTEMIDVSWPSTDGHLSRTSFYPMTSAAAERVLEVWPRLEARDINFDLSIAMMQRVSATSSFESTEPQRVYADEAASYIGIPTRDSIDLLINGWLASALFSEHDPESLPNQSNWYTIHVFSYKDQALWAASCFQETKFFGDTHVDGSFPFDALVHVNTVKPQSGAEMVTLVTAIHGSNLLTAQIYGDRVMVEHGLAMVRSAIEDIG